ncbi:MAG TPA: tetratricopeptide repeat protein [bacterium]|nr:tetratricopeptide repeat protein [bacterium]
MQANNVFVITENNVNEVLKQSVKIPMLLLFWAEQVPETVRFKAQIENMINKYNGQILLGLVNVEREQQIAMYLGISGIPELKLIIKGRVVDELEGVVSEKELLDFISRHIKLKKSEEQSTFDDIKKRIINFDFDGVERELLALSEKDKNNEKILIELVKYYLLTGNIDKAEELSQNIVDKESKFLIDAIDFWRLHNDAKKQKKIDINNADYDTKLILALKKILEDKDYEKAMAILLELIKQNKNYKEQIARKALVSIFTILGQSKKIEEYRNQLYNLLF